MEFAKYLKKKLLKERRLQKRPLLALTLARIYSFVHGLRASLHLLFRFPYAYIASDVRLIGIARIGLGKNVAIGRGGWLNVNDRTSKGIAIDIGDNSFIGMRNYFSVGRKIVIRDYCLTAMNCSFIGSTHLYDDPMQAYIYTGVSLDSDIYVGANCFFGYGAQVIGNVRIGHGCVLGAGAVIRNDIPPFSLVVGNPAKVIKRFDFSLKQWVAWPCDSYTEGPPEAEYIEHLRQQHGFIIHPISGAASRLGNIV